MLTKKSFGGDTLWGGITVWSDNDVFKYGEVVSEVRISFPAMGSESIDTVLEFSNNLFEAMTYAKQEEERLGITNEN